MSAQILDCKAVAQSIKDECKAAAEELKAKGIVPKLGIVRVGEKGPDLSYEKGATSTMNEAGIEPTQAGTLKNIKSNRNKIRYDYSFRQRQDCDLPRSHRFPPGYEKMYSTDICIF